MDNLKETVGKELQSYKEATIVELSKARQDNKQFFAHMGEWFGRAERDRLQEEERRRQEQEWQKQEEELAYTRRARQEQKDRTIYKLVVNLGKEIEQIKARLAPQGGVGDPIVIGSQTPPPQPPPPPSPGTDSTHPYPHQPITTRRHNTRRPGNDIVNNVGNKEEKVGVSIHAPPPPNDDNEVTAGVNVAFIGGFTPSRQTTPPPVPAASPS
ncbi:hypothetical protein BGX38DRAFT_1276716 [Terfezia claveryi]|nr:hypothetical protein BGX38DRAFT_1276716 [Terfezia claveryi]